MSMPALAPKILRTDLALDPAGRDSTAIDAFGGTHGVRGRLIIYIVLGGMFFTSLPTQSPSEDTANLIAPISTDQSPRRASRRFFGLLHGCRPHPTFLFSVVKPPRMCSIENGRPSDYSQTQILNEVTEIPQITIPRGRP